ncbi:MAG: DEAD/DEAH box helicase, partial [Acidimicrobiia bacterium]
GIVLITPESIESALIRSTGTSQSIFSDIEYVVVDEVHSFLDSSRGVHLQALLSRINSLSKNSIRHIGLSATLSRGSYDLAKLFFGKNKNTNVLADSSKNKLTITHSHNENIGSTVSSVTIDDIYKKSLNERMLVFPNSRRAVEDIAVRLEKRAKKSNSHVRYFSHHASVDKELRLEAE